MLAQPNLLKSCGPLQPCLSRGSASLAIVQDENQTSQSPSKSRDGWPGGDLWQDLAMDSSPGASSGVHAPGDAGARMYRLPSRKGLSSQEPPQTPEQPLAAQSADQQQS